jgi:hypothetical protein
MGVGMQGKNHITEENGSSTPDILKSISSVSALDRIDRIRQEVIAIISHLESISDEESAQLPAEASYIIKELQQVIESRTPVRARYYLTRLVKGLTKVRTNRFNDINLNRWKEYTDILTDSLWVLDKRDTSGVHTAGYWGNFVPQIPNQLIRRFTKPGDWVLDTFAGSGTTLIESQRLGRNCLGIELQESIAEASSQLVAKELNPYATKCEIVVGDCTDTDIRKELKERGADSVQLVIMHPPYYDIIKFSEDPRDMSNAADVDAFLELMGKAVDNVKDLLQPGRYLGLVIGDKFSKGEWIPLGFLTSQVVTSRGFMMKSIVVKNFEETLGKRTQKELWRFRSLAGGYYVFKHEYIFLFTKNE